MAAKQSAGILLYRLREPDVEVFLAHPGGPFWQAKDLGSWSIPKGELADGEEPQAAAEREFFEETGEHLTGPFVPLGTVQQAGGKRVHAWAAEGECDAAAIVSNPFTLEWPPRSGKHVQFPEVDRAEWFDFATAEKKINPAQAEFLVRLQRLLARP